MVEKADSDADEGLDPRTLALNSDVKERPSAVYALGLGFSRAEGLKPSSYQVIHRMLALGNLYILKDLGEAL